MQGSRGGRQIARTLCGAAIAVLVLGLALTGLTTTRPKLPTAATQVSPAAAELAGRLELNNPYLDPDLLSTGPLAPPPGLASQLSGQSAVRVALLTPAAAQRVGGGSMGYIAASLQQVLGGTVIVISGRQVALAGGQGDLGHAIALTLIRDGGTGDLLPGSPREQAAAVTDVVHQALLPAQQQLDYHAPAAERAWWHSPYLGAELFLATLALVALILVARAWRRDARYRLAPFARLVLAIAWLSAGASAWAAAACATILLLFGLVFAPVFALICGLSVMAGRIIRRAPRRGGVILFALLVAVSAAMIAPGRHDTSGPSAWQLHLSHTGGVLALVALLPLAIVALPENAARAR